VTAMRFEEIASGLRTGDIVLFSGKGLASAGIKRILGCAWSHVGLVVHGAAGGRPLLLESTPCRDLVDVLTGERTGGVRLVGLRERFASFEGDIAVRRLDPALAPAQIEGLMVVLRRLHGRPYERDLFELMRSVSARVEWRQEGLASLFCSELIAEILQAVGLLDDVGQGGRPSNEYTPHHFSDGYDLRLRLGFAFGREIRLERLAIGRDAAEPLQR
jgi:hypothetical protein